MAAKFVGHGAFWELESGTDSGADVTDTPLPSTPPHRPEELTLEAALFLVWPLVPGAWFLRMQYMELLAEHRVKDVVSWNPALLFLGCSPPT